ncbi:copine-8-like isoform X2 [Styela clava]|uniref:copine-8-like n=1 Tax=Styela clava TaxID=7725 RepID=UPI00193ADA05|nr:copine-8-like [Styela clava]
MAYGGQPPPQYTASPASYPSNGASATFTPSFSNDASWNSQPVHSVELAISCRGLIDADVFSKSDPMVVMYIQGLGTKEWREYGRTETIQNTLNPDFVTKFVIDYFFEERQALRFDVFDIDSKSAKLTKHDFLGQVFCTLGEIVGSPGSKFQAPLKIESRTKGKIIVTAEELDSSKDVAFMEWNGKKLDKKDLFGKSDPFMVFCRCNEDNSFTVCHKTEVIKNTLNPTWKRMQVPVRTLCNGDLERTIKIEIYDWDRDGGHDLIGIFTTSLSRLMRGPCIENTYECINPKKKKKKKSYKHSGLVNLLSFRIEKQPTFLEYIRSGTELSFVVAIDFTASNGNPMNPNSLHYINPYQPNQYAFAIQAVGEIIQDYDTDKLFPAYGFGARLPPHGQVSHEFAINFNPQNPFCNGIQGVMESYQSCIRKVQLYGPTNFSPIIRSVSSMAARVTDASQYFILLMITDGVISDMGATREAIVQAARLPMSIIIVGVGNDDFEAMEELDGDTVRLSYRGVEAERDIVQFVPFRDYMAQGNRNQILSQARLAKDVLAEIPDQFVGYMKKRNLKPGPPPPSYTPR